MKVDKTEKEKKFDEVENYIITTVIALLASFSVVLSSNKSDINVNKLSVFCSEGALLFLIITLIFCLWHKYRYAHRQRLFEFERIRIIRNHASTICEVCNALVPPYQKSQPDSQKAVNDENGPVFKMILSLTKNLGVDMAEAHKKILLSPLEESYSRIKFLLDTVSFRLRYQIFAVALILYFLALYGRLK